MISAASIDNLIETYKKYGWEPRRLLLRDTIKTGLDDSITDVPVRTSNIDAVWFSRPRQPERTPWELRHLGETPFSLLEHLDENSEDFEEQLSDIEHRMAESIDARKQA